MSTPSRPRFDPDSAAHRAFEAAARAAGFDPADRWVGGYADYEWDHLRLALDAYHIDVAGRDVLEFGCNVGGSSVVLAALGARLTGVDIDPAMAAIADSNLARHGLPATILAVERDAALPLGDDGFDLIIANSVLEYVEADRLNRVIGDFHRLLRPGGQLFICGTASRLALRERHSHRWLVNYLPTAFDGWAGKPLQRGLSPRRLARTLRGRFVDISADGWVAARRAIHGGVSLPARLYAALARRAGGGPGWIAPFIELSLRKID